MSKKALFFRLSVILLLIVIPFALFACNKTNPNDTTDDLYTLTLAGLVDADGNSIADTAITKAQIKTLFQSKPVVFDANNPAYASDKTDDNGNKIPHTLKGVYLEDIMAQLTASAGIDAYGSMTLNGADGYVTVATEEVFNSSGRGSKLIIAFEYDGISLTASEKSGALRAVFPDQIANCWAKKLNKIEFSTGILQSPAILKFTVLESLTQGFASYSGTTTINDALVNCTYFGIPLSALIDANVLNAQPTDKMHLLAWDYNSDTNSYIEYSAWTKHDVYSGGWLLSQRQLTGQDKEPLIRAPVFDGPDFSAGMTVKNILALSVYNSSVVSLETAFTRYDTDAQNAFYIKDLLVLLNMFDTDNSYTVTPLQGEAVTLTATQMISATVTKQGQSYLLNYGASSTTIASVAII